MIDSVAQDSETRQLPGQAPGRVAVLRAMWERWQEQPATVPKTKSRRRYALARKARHALACGVACFLMLQIGLAVIVETRRPGLRDPAYQANLDYLNKRRQTLPDAPVAVMLGSSRVQFALHPSTLERLSETEPSAALASFAQPGAGPFSQLLHLRHLLADQIVPDLLFVELMPALLNPAHLSVEIQDDYLPTSRLRSRDVAFAREYMGRARPTLEREWQRGLCCPWHVHRSSLVYQATPAWLPADFRFHAYEGRINHTLNLPRPESYPPARRAEALNHARKQSEPGLADLRLEGPCCKALEELLSLAQSKNVNTVLILYPESSIYRSWYTPDSRQRVEKELERLANAYAVTIVDARTWLADDDFFDGHHLLEPGAVRFSEKLWREVVAPHLQKR